MSTPSHPAIAALALALALLGGGDVRAEIAEPSTLPAPLDRIDFAQHLGETVPLDLRLTDSDGTPVVLGDLYGERPVLLVLVYYECPMLCSLTLNGLTKALDVIDFDPGNQFDVVVVSFDSRETPAQARATRAATLERYDRPGTEAGWHFLTGDADSIRRLTEAVGFSYSYQEEREQFAHASGVLVTTPSGVLARYLYGIEFPPRDLRLAVIEAADEKIGNVVDKLLLYCFYYDPSTGKYSAVALNMVRLGGVVTVVALAGLILTLRRRDPSRVHRPAAENV